MPLKPASSSNILISPALTPDEVEDSNLAWLKSNYSDDGMDFIRKYCADVPLDISQGTNHGVGAETSMTVDWADDEDFQAFFHLTAD